MKYGQLKTAPAEKERWIIRGDVAHVPGIGCGHPVFNSDGSVRVEFPDGSSVTTSVRRFRIVEAEPEIDPSAVIDELMFAVKMNSDYYVATAEAVWDKDGNGNDTDDLVFTLKCKPKGK